MYWNALGKIGIMGGRWAESIVLVYLLGTEGYGLFAAALNIMAFALPFTAIGMEASISRFLPELESSGKDPRPLLKKAIFFRLAICSAVAIGLIIFSRPIASGQLKDGALWPLVVIAAAIIVIHGLRNLQYRVLVARFQQRFLNGLQVGELFGYLLLGVLLILAGLSELGVLLALALAGLFAFILAGRRIRQTDPAPGVLAGRSDFSLKRLVTFSGTFYIYSLLNTVLEKPLDILLLSRLHPDLSEVAYYTVAYTFVLFSVSISGNALADGITLTVVSEAKESGDEDRLRRIFKLLIEYLYILTFPAVAGLAVVGRDLLDLLYQGKMEGAYLPLLVFLPAFAYGKISSILVNFLGALDRERQLVAGRVVFGVLNIVLDILWIPKYGALGAVFATSTASVVGTTFELFLVHLAIRPSYPWSYFGKMILISIGVGGCAHLINTQLPFGPWIRLPLVMVAGVVVYCAGLVFFKPISVQSLKLAATLNIPAKGWLIKLLTPTSGRR